MDTRNRFIAVRGDETRPRYGIFGSILEYPASVSKVRASIRDRITWIAHTPNAKSRRIL